MASAVNTGSHTRRREGAEMRSNHTSKPALVRSALDNIHFPQPSWRMGLEYTPRQIAFIFNGGSNADF